MKKILFALFIALGLFKIGYALDTDVWLSSNVNVNVSTFNLCSGQTFMLGTSTVTTGNHGVLHGVCINTAAAGNVQVFNSSTTATGSITGLLSTATQEPCNFYDVGVSSGLSFNKVGVGDISILYQCF